jgi:Zn-dependent protease
VTDFTLQQIVLRLCALVLIIGVHGLAVAGAACALGDPGPRYDERLRLSPLAHVDLLGLVSGVFFSVGWIKPVAVDPGKLRIGRIGLVVATLAGAVSVLVVVVALQWLRPLLLPLLSDTWSAWLFAFVDVTGQVGIWFAIVNLLPVPPFTGSLMLMALIPQAGEAFRRFHLYAALLCLGISATGIITSLLAPMHRTVAALVLAA